MYYYKKKLGHGVSVHWNNAHTLKTQSQDHLEKRR